MSTNDSGENATDPQAAGEPGSPNPAPQGGMQAVINHLSQDKIEASLWISRIATLIFTISFILPLFGVSQYVSGQRVLISAAITNALRLHQRVPQLRLSRELLGRLLSEDSAHYLFYCTFMLFSTQPTSISMMPVFLFALLHVTKYSKTLLNLLGPSSLLLIRRLIMKVDTHQREILKLIATIEVTLMPTTLLLIFMGQATLLLPFMYYRFLCMRYTSLRNPYNKTVFAEMRLLAEYATRDARCPALVATMIHKVIEFTCRMAPATAQPQQQ